MDGGGLALTPGFRFHPTDEELVKHYLCQKCLSQPIAVPIITEVDLYKFDPWQLPGMARYGEKEWYFFSPRDRKYPNGSRPNRAAGSGYWKATGADKPIGVPKTLGIKKALVFYAGKAPKGEKTNWIMHEYRLADVDRSARNKKNNNNLRLDDWVLCRIYNKKGAAEKNVSIDRKAATAKTATPLVALPPPTTLQAPKVEVMPITHVPLPSPPPPPSQQQHPSQPMSMEYAYFDTSDSIPRPPADSSSEHILSTPDFGFEKEVQSQPARWNIGGGGGWDRPVVATAPTSSSMAAPPLPPLDGDFSSVFGDNSMLQDIMMFLQKPF